MKFFTVKIYCKKCGTFLYQYQKDKKGKLIKCYKERIVKDFTNGDLKCPKCGNNFGREAIIHGKPAVKIVQGSVYVKG